MPRPSSRESCILVTLLLDALGAGIGAPVLPDLLAGMGDAGPDPSVALGLFHATYAGALFLCAPLLGRLSDLYGRRPVLLLAMAGCLAANALATVAGHVEELLATRLVAGICGASAAPAYAYITDNTPAERRPTLFGLMGATFGLGFVIGPALGGVLGAADPRLPFAAAALLAGLNFALGWVALTEDRPSRPRSSRLRGADLNPFAPLLLCRAPGLVRGILAGIFLYGLGQGAVLATWPVFGRLVLGWNAAEIGASLTALGVVWVLAQIGLTPWAIRRLGEADTLLLGILATALGFALFGLGRTGPEVYLVIVAIAPAFVTGPAAQTLLSAAVPSERRGALQGTIAALSSLATMIGSLLGGWSFACWADPAGPTPLPGAAFFLASLFSLLAFVSAWLALRVPSRPGREPCLPPRSNPFAAAAAGGPRAADRSQEADHVL